MGFKVGMLKNTRMAQPFLMLYAYIMQVGLHKSWLAVHPQHDTAGSYTKWLSACDFTRTLMPRLFTSLRSH